MTLGRTGSMVADRYRLDQLTASADTFEHWRARDERLGRPVVVRLDRVADAGGAAGSDGAEQSGEPAEDWSPQPGLARIAQLNYPAVAAVFDAGMVVDPVTGPLRYAVSEPVEGRSLAQVMAAGPQPWTRTVDWGRQICGALAALHGIGVAHGSLGPDNVAVRDDRMIKVFDAGLAPDLEAGDDADPDEDEPDEAQSGEPASTNAETQLIGGGGRDAGAAERTSVLPSEWTSASRISVEKSSVEKTIGMTAAMKLNLADYEAKIISKLPPGAPADMYALGSLLWHAVCGEPPAAVEAKPEAGRTDAGADAGADAGDEAGETGGEGDVDLAKTALIADPNAKTTVVRQQDGDDDRDSADRGDADRDSDDQDAAVGPDPAPLLAAGAPAGFALLLQELLDPDPARRPTSARALPRFAALVAAARASDKATMVVPPVPAQGPSPTQVIRTAPVAGRRAAAADAVVLPSQTPRRTLMLIGLILLLAALGTGIGVLVASVAGNSPQQQNNTPPVTSSTTGPVSSITLPSVTATSASPSPTQDTATTQPAAPPPSPSPSPSPSASASPSATDTDSAGATPTGSALCIVFPKLCASSSPS